MSDSNEFVEEEDKMVVDSEVQRAKLSWRSSTKVIQTDTESVTKYFTALSEKYLPSFFLLKLHLEEFFRLIIK